MWRQHQQIARKSLPEIGKTIRSQGLKSGEKKKKKRRKKEKVKSCSCGGHQRFWLGRRCKSADGDKNRWNRSTLKCYRVKTRYKKLFFKKSYAPFKYRQLLQFQLHVKPKNILSTTWSRKCKKSYFSLFFFVLFFVPLSLDCSSESKCWWVRRETHKQLLA